MSFFWLLQRSQIATPTSAEIATNTSSLTLPLTIAMPCLPQYTTPTHPETQWAAGLIETRQCAQVAGGQKKDKR